MNAVSEARDIIVYWKPANKAGWHLGKAKKNLRLAYYEPHPTTIKVQTRPVSKLSIRLLRLLCAPRTLRKLGRCTRTCELICEKR